MASKKTKFPEWGRILYRGVRAGIAAAIAQVIFINPDWANLETSWRNIAVVVVTAALPPIGMAVRDILDKTFGYDEKSLIQKVMPI